MFNHLLDKLKIGTKISILPAVAVIGLLTIAGVDTYLRWQILKTTTISHTSHELSLRFNREMYLQSNYLNKPRQEILSQVHSIDDEIVSYLAILNQVALSGNVSSEVNKIRSIRDSQNAIFNESSDVVQAITHNQNELVRLFHECDELANGKSDEITRQIFNLMMQGVDISEAKREFRNSLREYVGLNSNAMHTTNELLFFSDPDAYSEAEKARTQKLSLAMKACKALSIATDDPDDFQLWEKIEQKHHRINTLRTAIFEQWQKRESLLNELQEKNDTAQAIIQLFNQKLFQNVNKLAYKNKWINIVTLVTSLVFLLGVSFLLIRQITTPLLNLTKAMNRIKSGELEHKISIHSYDEIGILEKTFVDMLQHQNETDKLIRENEKKYRRLLESINTIPWELDLKTLKFTYVGPQAEKIFGYPLEEWSDFESWKNIIFPDDRESSVHFCMNETAKGEDHDFIYRAVHQNGSTLWIRDIVSVVKDDSEPVKLVGFMHDITQQKLAEKEKEKLESQLRQAYKMEAIGTMAGGIAHDFNNMLAIIIGNADMALDDIPKDNLAKHNLEKIKTTSNRAADLVRQILTFSRQHELRKGPLFLCSQIKEDLKLLRSIIPTTISIVHEIDADCRPSLADPIQINQLLMNLCTNAVHAMDEKGTLSISVQEVDLTEEDIGDRLDRKPGTYVRLTVSDTGTGMDQATMDRIFDPFYTTKEVGKGTGMGLAVVHGIVESHGAIITVESEPGEGSSFHVDFPITEAVDEELPEKDKPIPIGTERILFVDDETDLAEMGGLILENRGYKVTVKTNSVDALELFKSNPDNFDLVVTDQAMPNLSGGELSAELLKIRPDIPIILCTGYSAKISKEKAKEIGIREFCTKPLDRRTLATTVRKVLDEKV